MEIIEKMKPEPFAEYLNEYRNTICGRHPIAVLLNVKNLKFYPVEKIVIFF